MALYFIPLTYRYHTKHLIPQTYLGISLIVVAVAIILVRHKVHKWMQLIAFMYVTICVVFAVINSKLIIDKVKTHEAFYLGYTVALAQRMLDVRVANFKITILFNVALTILKFTLVELPNNVQPILVICLEAFPIILGFKSEQAERVLFDSLYESKKQLLKFKQLITEYLPNQIVIFSKDVKCDPFINDAFKNSFECKDPSLLETSLERLVLTSEDLEKNKEIFASLNCANNGEDEALTLSKFMKVALSKIQVVKQLQFISFEVSEDPKLYRSQNLARQQQKSNVTDKSISRKKNMETYKEESPYLGKSLSMDNIGTRTLTRNEKETVDSFKGPLLSKKPKKTPSKVREENDNDESIMENKESLELGARRVFKAKIFPLVWDNHEAIALVLDDITHEKTITELKISDKNKDLVIAMVSHELRTPLNGMLGLLEIIRKMLVQAEILPYLKACKNSSLLLLNLVNSILDFSQIKNNKLKLVETEVSIPELLSEIKSLFDNFCALKGLYLKMEVAPNVPKNILTDRTRLSQVLINLVGNAFKFTFEGGVKIIVSLESKKPCRIRFSVEDSGIGIKEEDQEKLFKLFGRLEQQDKKINTHGVGLGLTISNTIAMMLNPSENKGIQVSSIYGKGTSFYFAVQVNKKVKKEAESDESLDFGDSSFESDVERDASKTVVEKMANYEQKEKKGLHSVTTMNRVKSNCLLPNINSKSTLMPCPPEVLLKSVRINSGDSANDNHLDKVDELEIEFFETNIKKSKFSKPYSKGEEESPWCLIVDDNPFNLMVANNFMQEEGYLIKTALNGKEAIEKVKQHHQNRSTFKIILMDCQMPIMNGYEATRILQKMMKEGEIANCPIVALTANNRDEEHDKECLDAGMIGCISKPLKMGELHSFLRKF